MKWARSAYESEKPQGLTPPHGRMVRTRAGRGRLAGLAVLEREREGRRFEAQQPMIEYLPQAGRLRRDLDISKARDILWALTGRELYRNLAVQRGWSSDRYARWLAELLVSVSMTPQSPRQACASPGAGKGTGMDGSGR